MWKSTIWTKTNPIQTSKLHTIVNMKIIIFFACIFLHALIVGGRPFFSFLSFWRFSAMNANGKRFWWYCVGCIFIYTPSCLPSSTQERKSFANICIERKTHTHTHVLLVQTVLYPSPSLLLLLSPSYPAARRLTRSHRHYITVPGRSQTQTPSLSSRGKSKRDLISHYHYLCYYIIFKLNSLAAFIHKGQTAVCTETPSNVGPV